MTSSSNSAPGGIAICEDAWRLLRSQAAGVLPVYYIGTLPFALALVWLWFVAVGDPLAMRTLPLAALAAAVTYVWMKVWQARYAQLLMAQVQGTSPPRYGMRCFLRSVAVQAGLQSTAWLAMPVAVLLTAPVAWVYGFYQNAVVLDTGAHASAWRLGQDAMKHAKLWQKQNHVIFWMYSPFLLQMSGFIIMVLFPLVEAYAPIVVQAMSFLVGGLLVVVTIPLSPLAVIVFLNVSAAISFVFFFLKTFFAIDTVFTTAPDTLQNTPTFFVAILLASLCLDPLLKAAYVIRCFHSESRSTGQDIRVRLRGIRALLAALALVTLLGAASPAQAQAPGNTVDADRLGSAIDRTLDARKYNWRIPPGRLSDEDMPFIGGINAVFQDGLEWVKEKFDGFLRWIRDTFGRDEDSVADSNAGGVFAAFTGFLRIVLLLLCVGLLAMLAVLFYRSWRGRQEAMALEPGGDVAVAAVDLEDDATSADQLPEEGWLEMARNLKARGEHRLAIRALFLATLARLAHLGFIRIARFKSNRDYARELSRRAHAVPELLDTFSDTSSAYDAVWYGAHAATEETFSRLMNNQERLRGSA